MTVGFVSLGCSKNLVVTEQVIGMFKKNGFEITSDPSIAEIILVNTCGFITDAKEEAINTIFEMAEYKKDKCKYLIVIGCLVQRYKEELIKEIKEVDLFISIREYNSIWEKINKLINSEKKEGYLDYHNRMITTGETTAYLKIAEGCSNCCTYCAIPMIQGKYISREYEDIIKEANELANKGYQEIIVIAQDTTKYGIDLYGKQRLSELLNDLSKIKGIKWIRFLYAYPESITDELIEVVKNNEKICNYFDIPIQHISDSILTAMNRKSNEDTIKKLIDHIRKLIPDVIIRTTLIAGFPGESEDDFGKLKEFVKNYKIDKLGCFAYSKEENTKAAIMKNQIKEKIKIKRANEIMELQQQISKEKLKEKIGNIYEVYIEDIAEETNFFIGRSYMDVPFEDGVIYIKYNPSYGINEFVKCKITDSYEYDLVGEIID